MTSARTMDAKFQETEGFGEESSGKKKSKFKSIKKFFGKRKRKETLSSSGSGILKPSQSTSDVTVLQPIPVDYDSEDELEIQRSVMGSRALSHDSIFIPEAAPEPAGPVRIFSQENISDRIRALQLKLQQNWKSDLPYAFGTPSKKDDPGMNSEDDGLPRSPPESSLLQEILNSNTAKVSDSHKHLSSLSLAGTGSEEEEQVTSSPLRSGSTDSQLFPRQSSAKIITLRTSDRSLSPPVDFDAPPEFSSCLDNSAAKHKLLVKPRNQRCSRTRRSPSKNLSESQNDLSSTLEDGSDRKGMLAEQTYEVSLSHQELTNGAASLETVALQQPEMSQGLQQQTLSHQDKKGWMLHSASPEMDSLPFSNNQESCKTTHELPQAVSLSPSTDPKENVGTLHLSPDQEKGHLEILEVPSGNLSGVSLSIINQEKNISDVSSKSHTLPNKDVLAKNDVTSTSNGTEKDMLKDGKVLPEKNCNERTIKGSPSVSNPTRPSSNNSFRSTDLAYCENSSISQTFCPDPLPQVDKSALTLDKVEPNREKTKSDKESHHPAVPRELFLEGKAEKEASDLSALRKFSVSAARGRSRTGSLNIKEISECENLVSTQGLQAKMKNPSKITKVEMEKICVEKHTSLAESELESPARALDREGVALQVQDLGSKPVLSGSSGGLPQQSSAWQPNGEDKNLFHVKLRSTSLSLKDKDSFSEELKEVKRHSAEFNSGKGEVPVSFSLQGDKSEIRKTSDVNINSFLNKSLKIKPKSPEQGSTKPPLPRKPIVQHFVISGTNTSTEKQEKITRYPKFKNEDSEKKPGPPEVAEKSVPSLGTAVDSAKATDSPRMPAWIAAAKQKQRAMEQELSKEENPTARDKAEITEKQITKLKTEEAVKQQTDFTRSTFSSFPPIVSIVSFEEEKKETKLDTQESLPRASLLSHHNPVHSSVTSIEKEDAKPIKKVSDSSPDQPSWMELAKKKAQAWNDMPQRIK